MHGQITQADNAYSVILIVLFYYSVRSNTICVSITSYIQRTLDHWLYACAVYISDTMWHCLHLKIVVENMWDGWVCAYGKRVWRKHFSCLSEVTIRSMHKPGT